MGKRRISHAEQFPVMNIDTLPSRRGSVTPEFLSVGCSEGLPSKNYSVKREWEEQHLYRGET